MIHIDISKEYLSILNIPLCYSLDVYRRNLFTKQTSIDIQIEIERERSRNGKEKLKKVKMESKIRSTKYSKNMT